MTQTFKPISYPANIRSSFNRPPRQQITFTGPGRTKQSFKDECDINTIMRRYQVTGALTHLAQREPQYIDATGHDFTNAMHIIAEAKSRFAELPAEIRAEFDNDPAQLLDFVHDPANIDQAVEWGFLDRDKLPQSFLDAGNPRQATPVATGFTAPHQGAPNPSGGEVSPPPTTPASA